MKTLKGPYSYEERCSSIVITGVPEKEGDSDIMASILPRNYRDGKNEDEGEECDDHDEVHAKMIVDALNFYFNYHP